MAVLNFTLSEEGVAVFHDALACIVKFSEDVVLEARKDKVGVANLSSRILFSYLAAFTLQRKRTRCQ